MKRLPMRKIREALKLQNDGFSRRQVAQSLILSRPTITRYYERFEAADLSWPLPDDLTDSDLERLLYPRKITQTAVSLTAEPNWSYVHGELRRKNVTLSLLWEEYRSTHPDGVGYSRYCALYRKFVGKLSPVMRQHHPAGERLFIDYAGQTVDVICQQTGAIRTAQIFVATLGASNYTYVEATWTQSLPDWMASHTRSFAFFGGVTAQLVPDNLRSGVSKACLYDPVVNRTYADMAYHYDTAILPTRPRKPKDKAKVEGAVLIVERWILARLRNHRFFSLDEVNAAIRPLQDLLNNKVTRHLGASRKDLFLRLDKPALKALPIEPYIYAVWKQCRAGLDYHINVAGHYYSVPHQLLKQKLWVRITSQTLEAYHDGQRVASHVLMTGDKRHSTHKDHMPAHHRFRKDWTPERIRLQAAKVGPNVEAFVEVIMGQRRHPEKGYRACQGVMRLSKEFGEERLDAACARAIAIKASSYSSLHSILKNGLDRQALTQAMDEPAITHTNIRGANYFH